MIDVDLGPALLRFLLVFVVLPSAMAAMATVAMVRLVPHASKRLAIGAYAMLVGVMVAPAPIVWGDDHLGLAASQALEAYGALFWTVGTITTLSSLKWVQNRRRAFELAVGLAAAVVLCGWVLGATFGPAVGLALIPATGTLVVVLTVAWLAHRNPSILSGIDWRWAARVGALAASVVAAFVYGRGPVAFGALASGADFALLALLACLPILVLARWPTNSARRPP